MKRLSVITLMILLPVMAFSQLRIEKQPRSFSLKEDVKYLQINNIPKPDMDKIYQEDETNDTLFKIRRFGVILPVGKDLIADSKQLKTDEGTIYLMRFAAEDAEALALYSSNFYIPEGGELYLYTADKYQVIGAFTALNNNEERTFATELLLNDDIVVEYFQPSWQSEMPTIEITEIGYAYRDMDEMKAASGSCNVNINCPEGNNYRNQQRAVCKITVYLGSFMGWCSGTLMNNTALDKSPLVLSAAHCIYDDYGTLSNKFSQFVFYFNYASASCTGTYSSYKTLTGATLKAKDSTVGEDGSDFCLMLLNDQIPDSYNPYWCGWTRSTDAATSGVGIHHPNGDIMKISTYTTPLSSTSIWTGNSNTHWLVSWKQTQSGYGITEEGSSGSALFNQNGLVVGTLSGGWSGCYSSDKTDCYGKISYSWASNGTTSNSRLKPWLDPANTNVTQLSGSDFKVSLHNPISGDNNRLILYPNPANDNLTISLLDDDARQGRLNIINAQGRIIYSSSVNTNRISLSTATIPDGLYLIQLIAESKYYIGKISIAH